MLYFTIQNRLQDGTSKVSEAVGLSSDVFESSFYWLPLKSGASRFRGRRTIW